jgi:hypothetical protein
MEGVNIPNRRDSLKPVEYPVMALRREEPVCFQLLLVLLHWQYRLVRLLERVAQLGMVIPDHAPISRTRAVSSKHYSTIGGRTKKGAHTFIARWGENA